ncbi:helix-turn-helix domain-containing protein [Neolewinella agarilytica]|uniref:Helix-turn-helix n=1 Tax=Neolewinella agarilytica TaxID=478744 RepID=A0A1H9HB70_9BACT|nr:helix-turn-helix transcriptional regulator [Neolewinella agarilytica]SEQ59575.1 hypothetical protein SAMN05444359_11289 [Neolewinella agarilytica]
MKKSEKMYAKLSARLTDEEIVDGYLFNDDEVSAEEREVDHQEFLALRMKRLSEMTEGEKLFGRLMKLKYRMQDYFETKEFDPAYSFARLLKGYSSIINRSNKEFAKDLGLHHSKLSRLLNGKEKPNVELMYRLDKHSNGELPAHYWWRLYAKEFEHTIMNDQEKRAEESKRVSNALRTG